MGRRIDDVWVLAGTKGCVRFDYLTFVALRPRLLDAAKLAECKTLAKTKARANTLRSTGIQRYGLKS